MSYLEKVELFGKGFESYDAKIQNWWDNEKDRSVLDSIIGEKLELYKLPKEHLYASADEMIRIARTSHFDMFVLDDGSYLVIGKVGKEQVTMFLCE